MLERLTPSLRSIQTRNWRARRRNGQACATVLYDGRVLDLLIAGRWLAERDAADRKRVGKAIAAMLADAAKKNL